MRSCLWVQHTQQWCLGDVACAVTAHAGSGWRGTSALRCSGAGAKWHHPTHMWRHARLDLNPFPVPAHHRLVHSPCKRRQATHHHGDFAAGLQACPRPHSPAAAPVGGVQRGGARRGGQGPHAGWQVRSVLASLHRALPAAHCASCGSPQGRSSANAARGAGPPPPTSHAATCACLPLPLLQGSPSPAWAWARGAGGTAAGTGRTSWTSPATSRCGEVAARQSRWRVPLPLRGGCRPLRGENKLLFVAPPGAQAYQAMLDAGLDFLDTAEVYGFGYR